jgi:hypothetical protein
MMPLTDEQMALFEPYNQRVQDIIERSRKSRAAGKPALADRQLELCVDVYREYALSQKDIRFQVSYLVAIAVSFAMRMGMHEKAHKVMSEAEGMCPQDDTELREAVAKMRVQVDRYRAQKYDPLKHNPKYARKGRLQ